MICRFLRIINKRLIKMMPDYFEYFIVNKL